MNSPVDSISPRLRAALGPELAWRNVRKEMAGSPAQFFLPTAQDRRRVVGGAVVNDENFDGAIGLALSRSERFIQKRGAVEGWDDDGCQAGRPAGSIHRPCRVVRRESSRAGIPSFYLSAARPSGFTSFHGPPRQANIGRWTALRTEMCPPFQACQVTNAGTCTMMPSQGGLIRGRGPRPHHRRC